MRPSSSDEINPIRRAPAAEHRDVVLPGFPKCKPSLDLAPSSSSAGRPESVVERALRRSKDLLPHLGGVSFVLSGRLVK